MEHVVGIDQEVPGLAHLHGPAVAGWQRTQLWHPNLNDEATARCKLAGGVPETADLFVLCQEVVLNTRNASEKFPPTTASVMSP